MTYSLVPHTHLMRRSPSVRNVWGAKRAILAAVGRLCGCCVWVVVVVVVVAVVCFCCNCWCLLLLLLHASGIVIYRSIASSSSTDR